MEFWENIITVNTMIVVGIAFGVIVITTQVVLFFKLLHERAKIKDYNKFVYTTFTQNARKTPAIILRIQNDNILHYNRYLERCRFLSLFFREVDYIGESPVKIVDLFKNNTDRTVKCMEGNRVG